MIFARLYLANIVVYTRLQFPALDIIFVKEEALLVGERVRMSLVWVSKPVVSSIEEQAVALFY